MSKNNEEKNNFQKKAFEFQPSNKNVQYKKNFYCSFCYK